MLLVLDNRHHFWQSRGWRLLLGNMIDHLMINLLRLLKSIFSRILVTQGHQLCHTLGLLHSPLEQSLIDHYVLFLLLHTTRIWRIDSTGLQSAQIILVLLGCSRRILPSKHVLMMLACGQQICALIF